MTGGIDTNMIENINYTSFLKYGSVIHPGYEYAISLQKNFDKYVTTIKTINTKKADSLLSFNNNVVMDIISGVALLYITSSLDKEGCFFLLDKTIVINGGLHFNVLSLYGSCDYQFGYFSEDSMISTPHELSAPVGFSSNINIPKIHTLFYQEKEKGFKFKGESHDFWELTYVDKGKMYTKIEDKSLTVSQGQAIFYKCGQYHTQWSDEDLSISFITITFDMSLDDSSINDPDFEENNGASPTTSNYSITDKVYSVDNEMKVLLQKILNEKENNSFYSDDLILCHLKEFVIKLIRNSRLEKAIIQQDNIIRTRIDDTIISKCTNFIKNNIENKISVPDVAKSIPISPSYLSAIFRKKMDMTVVDYINNYKLEKSKEMIKIGNLNFTQISEKLGYTSVHYFSRQFKLKYGISPSEYAKSINGSR